MSVGSKPGTTGVNDGSTSSQRGQRQLRRDNTQASVALPPEIRDDGIGVVAKSSGRLSVGRGQQHRAVS